MTKPTHRFATQEVAILKQDRDMALVEFSDGSTIWINIKEDPLVSIKVIERYKIKPKT